MKNPCLIIILAILFSGCTTSQKIVKVDASKMSVVCIVQHEAVRESVLETIQEGLTNHGVQFKVIPGSYQTKGNKWVPTVQDDQVIGCDALLFYVAHWNWDIAMYMRSANIWMTTPDQSNELGFAVYDARSSLNKFINAREKLLELVDGLFEGQKGKHVSVPKQDSVANVPPQTGQTPLPKDQVSLPVEKSKSVGTTSSDTSQKLRELKGLKDEGLISEADYQKKKKQLLEKF